jgi:phage tail protein X
MVKPSKKAFTITLIALAAILLCYGLARMAWGPLLPATIDKNLPDALIVIAIGIMLWNRQIANEEKKAAEAAKEAEKLKAVQVEEASKTGDDGEDKGAGA